LRLAFSVAAFLEPEVLLLDEVLAVGDAEFQKKGLQKMDEVAKSGRTILFISHNMAAVRQLCTRGIVLENGQIQFDGSVSAAVDHYLQKQQNSHSAVWINKLDISPKFLLERIEIRNAKGELTTKFLNSESIFIHFHTRSNADIANLSIGFDLMKDGITVLRSRQIDSTNKSVVKNGESNVFICKIPSWLLNAGNFTIRPNAAIYFTEYLSKAFHLVELPFEVSIDASRSIFHQNLDATNQPGGVFPTLEWGVEPG
jgi:lipopolysaccharide transport system ATP-binding protein